MGGGKRGRRPRLAAQRLKRVWRAPSPLSRPEPGGMGGETQSPAAGGPKSVTTHQRPRRPYPPRSSKRAAGGLAAPLLPPRGPRLGKPREADPPNRRQNPAYSVGGPLGVTSHGRGSPRAPGWGRKHGEPGESPFPPGSTPKRKRWGRQPSFSGLLSPGSSGGTAGVWNFSPGPKKRGGYNAPRGPPGKDFPQITKILKEYRARGGLMVRAMMFFSPFLPTQYYTIPARTGVGSANPAC